MNLNKLSPILFRLKPTTRLVVACRQFIQFKPQPTPQILGCLGNQAILVPQQNVIIKRFKKGSKKSRKADDDDEADDDEDDDELEGENPLLVDDLEDSSSDGSQKVVIDIPSLRLDAFSKTAFAITRAKIEESFYKGELFLNGERPSKKSSDLSINDEIDLVKGVNAEDRNMIDIRRVVLVELPDKSTEQGRMKVTIKRWNDLTIKPHGSEER